MGYYAYTEARRGDGTEVEPVFALAQTVDKARSQAVERLLAREGWLVDEDIEGRYYMAVDYTSALIAQELGASLISVNLDA